MGEHGLPRRIEAQHIGHEWRKLKRQVCFHGSYREYDFEAEKWQSVVMVNAKDEAPWVHAISQTRLGSEASSFLSSTTVAAVWRSNSGHLPTMQPYRRQLKPGKSCLECRI